jgi:hypothetical protein
MAALLVFGAKFVVKYCGAGRGEGGRRDEGSNATDRTSIGRQMAEIWQISLLRSLVKIAKFDIEYDFEPISIDLDR